MVRFLGRLLAGWCLSLIAVAAVGFLVIMVSVDLAAEVQTAAYEKAIARKQPQDDPLFVPTDCQLDNPESIKACRYVGAWGDIDVQYTLGHLYETGSIVPTDMQEAARWYEKAALQGHLAALYKTSKAKSSKAYDAERNEKLSSITDMIESYAWFCVWDKQMINPQAPGHVAWDNLTEKDDKLGKDFRDTRLHGLAAMPLPTRMIAKRLCQRYIDIMLSP